MIERVAKNRLRSRVAIGCLQCLFTASYARTKHNRVIPLGVEFLREGSMCLGLSATLEAGDFFSDLRSRKTNHGIEFYRGSVAVKIFPEQMKVKVYASLNTCSESSTSKNDGVGELQFDDEFLNSLRFGGFWKRGLQMEKINDIAIVNAGPTANPGPITSNADWWVYELQIRSSGVPLDEALVVEIFSKSGKSVARFSGHL